MSKLVNNLSLLCKKAAHVLARMGKVFPIVLVLMLTLTSIVFAAYTGPNRSTYVSDVNTYWERKHCNYEAWYDPAGTGWYGCHADNYTSPDSGCPGFSNWTNSACGWPGGAHVDGTSESSGIEGCSSGQSGCTSRTVDNSYWQVQNPPLVSGTNNCATPGKNGWCVAGATISLSGSDPVYTATGIEGSVNGAVTTLCSGTSCTWSYPQGTTNLDYWTLSSHGDTSNASSTTMKFDSIAPTGYLGFSAHGDIDGGWVIDKQADFNYVNVEEDGSGLASAGIRVNGGALLTLPTTVNYSEGPVTITGTLEDNAGNVGTFQTYSFKIDFTDPVAIIHVDKTPNAANWFNQPVTISATGTDNLSGYKYTNFAFYDDDDNDLGHGLLPTTITDDGEHQASFEAYDEAGNFQSIYGTYNVDTTPPTLSPTISGTPGNNGWYTSHCVGINYNAADNLSGIMSYSPGTPLSICGAGTITNNLQVADEAGNDSELVEVTVKLDSGLPSMSPTIQGVLGNNGYYVSDVTVRGHAEDEVSGVFIDPEKIFTVDGTYDHVELTAEDYAGNTSSTTLADPIHVDQTDPTVSINAIASMITGSVTFSGTVSDAMSGVNGVSFSYDNGSTWYPAVTNIDGTWSIVVDTTALSGGTKVFTAKAEDKAGNEYSVNVSTNVSNRVASMSLPSQWNLGQSEILTVIPGDAPVKSISVSLCDPRGVYNCISLGSYTGNQSTIAIDWDGKFGSTLAAAGDYEITANLEDEVGQKNFAYAVILVPEASVVPSFSPLVNPTSTAVGKSNEGELISFYGFVDSFDDSSLVVDGTSYTLADDTIIDATNGKLVPNVLVSGTAMSLSGRLVSVRTIAVAGGDELVNFQGVISYWSEPGSDGSSWMVIDDLAYKITSSTSIYGQSGVDVFVVGMERGGEVISMWVTAPDSSSSLVQFKGTVSEIIGNVDQLPYTISVEGLNYQISDQSIITGDPMIVGVYVTGTAMGNDRLVLGVQVANKKPGLWSLALDFFNTTLGLILVIGFVVITIILCIFFILHKKRKNKKDQDQAVDDALGKLSN